VSESARNQRKPWLLLQKRQNASIGDSEEQRHVIRILANDRFDASVRMMMLTIVHIYNPNQEDKTTMVLVDICIEEEQVKVAQGFLQTGMV
jgi:hypothetical protein